MLVNLPPLARLIQGCAKALDPMNCWNSLTLCEANLAIGRHEYKRWKGWAIVDATSVFSLEGLVATDSRSRLRLLGFSEQWLI